MESIKGYKNTNEQQKRTSRFKRGLGIAAVALAATAAAASFKASHEQAPSGTPAENVPTRMKAKPEKLSKILPTLNEQYKSTGYAVELVPPNDNLREYFAKKFQGGGGKQVKVPSLKEIAVIKDRKGLPRSETSSRRGLQIYNASSRPIDLEFVTYAMESVEKWVDANANKRVRLNDTVTTTIKRESPNAPRDMLLVDHMPQSIVGSGEAASTVPALTDKTGNVITSWVNVRAHGQRSTPKDRKEEHKMFGAWADDYLRNNFIATELCQSYVNVDGAQKIAGGNAELKKAERFLSLQNDDVANNLDLYAQEIVCNSVSRVITASYFGGDEGVRRVAAHDGTPKGWENPILAFDIASGQTKDFQAIEDRVGRGGDVITMADEQTLSSVLLK